MSGEEPGRMLPRRVAAALLGLAAALAGLAMPGRLLASTTITCDAPVLMAAQLQSPQQRSAHLGWAIAVGQVAGQTWLAAGANQDNANAGSVSMFLNPGPGTPQTDKLVPPEPGGRFGTSVSIGGDWLAVGAPLVGNSGAVYLYMRKGSSWMPVKTLAAADAAAGAQFGFSVSLNGNGTTLVVGAPGDSDRGSSSGSVYVFTRQETVWQPAAKFHAFDGRPFDEFGAAVAVAGDEIVVGAPFADDLQAFQNFGAAYVFQRTASGWALEANGKLTAGTFRPGNIQFGSAVAIGTTGTTGGGRIVVGVPGDDMNLKVTDSGSAYVFERNGAGAAWMPSLPLMATDPRQGAQFGTAVRLYGDSVLIGAPFDGNFAGAAYLFVLLKGSWSQQFKFLHAPGSGAFSQSVEILGTEVFLGGFKDSSGGVTEAGAVATCPFGPPPPCLELKKTHTSSSGPTGVTVAFQVRVVNCGASPLTVTVSDVFQGTGLIDGLWCPGRGCTPSKAGNLLDTVTLPAGGDQVYTVAGLEPCAGSVANTACVAVAGQPSQCKQDVALASPVADLAVTGSGPAAVVAGNAATYDWQVENLGPCPARAVVLTAPLAPDLDLVESAPSSCAATAGALTCSLGQLNPLDQKTVHLVLRVRCDRPAGPLTETARATAVTPDPVTANNSATVTATVKVKADYSIVKTCPVHAEASEPIAYTLTVRNGGPSCPPAAVSDLLPEHLLDGQWCQGAGCMQGNVAAQVALLPLDSTVFNVRGVVDPVFLGPLSNTATVTLLQGSDPASGDNSDTCTTDVTPRPPLPERLCTIDARPAATLLLPYFEVDLDDPNGLTTLFSVNNASAAAILVHVVGWSDLSVPVFNFNIYLTGYDTQSVNLRDILVNGNVPRTASAGQDPLDKISPKGPLSQDIDFANCKGILPPPALPAVFIAHLQAALTGRPSAMLQGNCAGQALGDNIARGYVTMDTVNNCTMRLQGDDGYFAAGGAGDVTNQNVLWGDWFIVNAAQNFAEGSDLVHIVASPTNPATSTAGRYTFYGRYDAWSAVDSREPLATEFAVRYRNGGPFTAGTSLLVWRDSKVNQIPFPCPATLDSKPPWYPLGQEGITIFDEQEQPSVPQTAITPFPAATQRTQVNGAVLPVPFEFGWLVLNLNTTVAAAGNNPPVDPAAAQAWVVTTLATNSHFAVGIDGIRLDSACAAVHLLAPQ